MPVRDQHCVHVTMFHPHNSPQDAHCDPSFQSRHLSQSDEVTCLRQAAEPGFKLEVTPNLALFFALHDARDASDLLKVTGSTVTRTQAPGLPIQGLLLTP